MFEEEEIYPFIREWQDYCKLPKEQQNRVKQIKINAKQMKKKLIKDIINSSRPMSWSSIYSWKYSKEDWAKKYLEGISNPMNPEMKFGKTIGEKIEKDITYLPQIERFSKMEYKFLVELNNIPLVGYADTFCDKTFKKLGEFKTGKKVWDQKRCDEHGQITMYCLMNYIQNKIPPEEVDITLTWMPTRDTEDFNISFVEPIEENIKTFKTKRTMSDILNFAAEIKEIYAEMELYCQNMAKQSHKNT